MEESLPEKFASVSDLVNAYKNLESEFTKRNNELKALKEENERLKTPTEQKEEKEAFTPPDAPEQQESKSDIKVFSGGKAVRTLPYKPKTLAEANALAQQFLKGE